MEQRNWPGRGDALERGPIRVRVATVDQFFNAIDPSPHEERELHVEVADWIEEWAEDLDRDAPVAIEVFVDGGTDDYQQAAMASAVHNHFEFRAWQTDRQFRKLLRDGRTSLLVGIVFFSLLTGLATLLASRTAPAMAVLREGLFVTGWVAMWKPIGIFLYEWWPLRRERRACERLASAPVTFTDVPPPLPRRQRARGAG